MNVDPCRQLWQHVRCSRHVLSTTEPESSAQNFQSPETCPCEITRHPASVVLTLVTQNLLVATPRNPARRLPVESHSQVRERCQARSTQATFVTPHQKLSASSDHAHAHTPQESEKRGEARQRHGLSKVEWRAKAHSSGNASLRETTSSPQAEPDPYCKLR